MLASWLLQGDLYGRVFRDTIVSVIVITMVRRRGNTLFAADMCATCNPFLSSRARPWEWQRLPWLPWRVELCTFFPFGLFWGSSQHLFFMENECWDAANDVGRRWTPLWCSW